MIGPNDHRVFGDLLSRRKFATGKTFNEIARELGLASNRSAAFWHEGSQLPKEERLSAIAETYEVSLEELRSAYGLAKDAMNQEKSGKKKPGGKKGAITPDVYGSLNDSQTRIRTNSQLPNWRFRER
jgi:transcriptional regulator with XRE-family HTH domain